MVAIPRQRKKAAAGLGLQEDGAMARLANEVQARLSELAARVQVLEGAPAATGESKPFDSSDLERRIGVLEAENAAQKAVIDHLKLEFPVHRFAKVDSIESTYVVCHWYYLTASGGSTAWVEGPLFNMAPPPGKDTSEYTVGDIVTVVPARTGVQVDGVYLQWMENSGGGGGLGIPEFEYFPQIPSQATVIACKHGLWFAMADYPNWKPCTDFTNYGGIPGT